MIQIVLLYRIENNNKTLSSDSNNEFIVVSMRRPACECDLHDSEIRNAVQLRVARETMTLFYLQIVASSM